MNRRAESSGTSNDSSETKRAEQFAKRVKISRREKKRFKQIARRYGMSAGDMIAVFMRRTIAAGKFSFEPPHASLLEPSPEAVCGQIFHGVSVSALSELTRAVAGAAHLPHAPAGRHPDSSGSSIADLPACVDPESTFDDQIEARFMDLLASDELVLEASFLARIGWTRQTLKRAIASNRMFCVEVKGVRAYPSFFLKARYDRHQLESVTTLMSNLSGGSKWLFFTTPKASLALPAKLGQKKGTARTPLQALEAGDIKAVERSALGSAACAMNAPPDHHEPA